MLTHSPVSIFNARRLRMVRCETFGPGGVSCQRKLEDCQFSQNRFMADRRWRGHMFKFWGAEHCIFEDNLLTGDTRGLVMQTHFGANYQNFIAGNTAGTTWYHKKICTSNGMLRKNSTHALPKRTAHLLSGSVRMVPITMPATKASTKASNATDTVQPHADSIQSK